ncbi:hypothetical protein BFF78_42000 [Streptomyces fodineus]|uniref:Uncharacterized protein n=1 Tax=Streptomyces fodineus TaxID=1904616 RepID=A0A1D7YMD5_9ACTN|nr:hypothetical protein [Streptomyces fodineus]AOR36753.1 hypothetical protein BFF78_42000 [Streptomyces fodineus]
MPGVDWEAVRGLPKGAVSPLREYAALALTRATVVKGFAQALADRHGTTVWAWNSPYSEEQVVHGNKPRPARGHAPVLAADEKGLAWP